MTCLDLLTKLIATTNDEYLNQHTQNPDKVKLLELCAKAIDTYLSNNDGECLLVDIVYEDIPLFIMKIEVPYMNITDKTDPFLAVLQVAMSLIFEATSDNENLVITLTLPGIWDENEYE